MSVIDDGDDEGPLFTASTVDEVAHFSPETPGGGLPQDIDLASSERLPVGTELLRARIGDRCIPGGFGRVYEATHVSLPSVRLAVKTVLPPSIGHWQERAEMLRSEAVVLSQFTHPNIVRVFDFASNASGGVLVVEWVDGGSVADRIRNARQKGNQLPLEDVMRIFAGVAHGLDTVHRAHVIHRDIKPANIMLASDGVPKVADFGTSLVDTEPGKERTVGTFAYMSPESLLGKSETASDVYSLGVSLFEALTGMRPVVAEMQNAVGWYQAHRRRPMPSVHEFRGDLPPEVGTLVEQMCDLEPANRPQALEVARHLEAVLARQESLGRLGHLPLPIRRVRRDARARMATPWALPAAIDYFETILNYLVAVLSSPHSEDVAKYSELVEPMAADNRMAGLAAALESLVAHVSHAPRRVAPVAAAARFLLSGAADWPKIAPHGDPPPDWLRRGVDELRHESNFLQRARRLAHLLCAAELEDEPVAARQLAANLMDGLDATLRNGPELPAAWWYVCTNPDDPADVEVQRLTGEQPGPSEHLRIPPAEIDTLLNCGGRGLFVRDGERLLPLEPFATWDDGEWYLLAGTIPADADLPEQAEYRCSTTGHRLRWEELENRRAITGACFDALRGLFPNGLPLPAVAVVRCTEIDFRSDLQRLPDELAPLLARAAASVSTDPAQSIASSVQAARLAFLRALGEGARVDLIAAADRERVALLPRVPAGVIALAEVAARAGNGPARSSSALLAMFAAVRIALWQAGAVSGMLNFNMKTCATILASHVGALGDDLTSTTFRRSGSPEPRPPERLVSVSTAWRGRANAQGRGHTPDPGSEDQPPAERITLVALDPSVLAEQDASGRVECNLPAEIGVSSRCEIPLDSRLIQISRRHARFEAAQKGMAIRHLAFGNRTAVNGCRLTRDRPVRLRRDDLVTLDVLGFVVR